MKHSFPNNKASLLNDKNDEMLIIDQHNIMLKHNEVFMYDYWKGSINNSGLWYLAVEEYSFNTSEYNKANWVYCSCTIIHNAV